MEFLERFYQHGIYPAENGNRPGSEEYRVLGRQSGALLEQLQSGLNQEQKELLEKLLEVKLHIQSFEMAVAFSNGFTLGGRLVAEVYRDTQ
jgi:predicted transposase YdaD